MEKNSKIYVAGHRGMVGSAIVRKLQKEGFSRIITRTSAELDLRNQQAVNEFFAAEKPEYVFLAAAKVGGIMANNTYRADFLYENLILEANIIHAAYTEKVAKLLFLGSSCIYPKLAPQPLKEEHLLTGLLEPTNEPYAIAKIAGIKLCETYRDQYGCNFISAMPTNLYGQGDNYHLQNSHVIPALIRKFHEAKLTNAPLVEIWGSGKPLREFMYVDDLADGCVFLMNHFNERLFINIGTGEELTIAELAVSVGKVVGYAGELRFDSSKPDGTPRKLMDSSRIKALGWSARTSLVDGLTKAYQHFLQENYRH
ncbi:MAG: GDP-L-fucose synthase [Chitinophagaceae bacterium]|nr:GDP-L-fucose synthase [Chitinophagaceae bacterium]